jgi:hypothetical protein
VIPVCTTERDNDLVLTFDNQVIDPVGHPADHNCGGIHVCTPEPDTAFLAVRIDGQLVEACDTVDAASGTLEIDFLVTDTDEHLATYSLIATYGVNLSVNLLNRPGATVTPLLAGTFTGHDPGNSSGTYGVALGQGATAPHWAGGRFRLTLPAGLAFPEPCCYQLELRAWKRTVVGTSSGNLVFSCEHGMAHANLSEYTLGVGVCAPPEQREAIELERRAPA